jgi:DNA repair protein SbcC/Rad50
VRVLELQLRNYRVFEEVDLELPARVIGVFGENGAGKSTLMESIAFALYGVDAARTKKDGIRTHGLLADCEARISFEHGGGQYEVRRALSGRNHSPSAELFVGGSQLATGVSEVDAEIQRLLHMDLRVFRSSVFAEQKQLDAFSDVTAAKRKEMALRLLGIKPVDDARAAARKQARATKQGADQLVGAVPDVAQLEAELKEAGDLAEEAGAEAKRAATARSAAERLAAANRKAFEAADEVRERLERLIAVLEASESERRRLESRREELTDRAGALRGELTEGADLASEAEALEGAQERLDAARRWSDASVALVRADEELELLVLPDLDRAAEAVGEAGAGAREAETAAADARASAGRAGGDVSAAEERVARASQADPSAPCPTCGQELGAGFAGYVRHAKAELAAAKKAATAATKQVRTAEAELKRARAELDRARTASDEARGIADRRSLLAARVDELRETATSLAAPFDGVVPDIELLAVAAGRASEVHRRLAAFEVERKRLAEIESDLADLENELTDVAAREKRLREESAGLEFDSAEHERLRSEADGSTRAVEELRNAERVATSAAGQAALAAERLRGQIVQARETERTVGELRDEARVLDRVSTLLDGFRDQLVARVGPELSREAEALFRELTDHEYDDLKIDESDLSIRIADGDTYFPIERFSGSEVDLANLALRVAISTHLSRVSGADVGLLVLDEVLGSLDHERKDLLVQTMGRLTSRFHQLFVITHAEQVKDQFPASIVVSSSEKRRSTAVLV